MGRKARLKQDRSLSENAAAPPGEVVDPTGSGRQVLLAAVILVVLVAAVFGQLRSHEFLNHDDPIYVTGNDHVKQGLTIEGVKWAFTSMDFNWHPLTWLTHMLDVQLFGVNAGPHLLMNALLHAISTILLLLLLVRATRRVWPSFFAAALFAIHPLHVESVAWLAERKDVLSTLFFLLTIYLYVIFVSRRSKAVYAAMVLTFILGLMSKGMVVTLPFVLLLLDFWPLGRVQRFDGATIGRLVIEKLPLFALVIPGAIVTYQAQHVIGGMVDVKMLPFPLRAANAAISYVSYLWDTIWPAGLAIPYPYPAVISKSDAAMAIAILLVITVLAAMSYRRRPYLLTGWLWFLGTLVPVIGLVQIGIQARADRYTYIPLIGIFIAVVWTIDSLLQSTGARRAAAVAAAVVILMLTAAAHVQASYWKNSETLFRHSVSVTRNNVYAYLNLGEALLQSKDPAGAARELETAIALYPGSALAHHNLAEAYAAMGRTGDAIKSYQRSLQIEPNDQVVIGELAALQLSIGNEKEAKRVMTQAGAQQGDPASLAALALERGDVQGALKQYSEIVAKQPQSASAHNDLAAAYAKAGRDDDALREYQEAIRLDPSLYDARMNIGALLSRRDRAAEALAQFEAAAKLKPGSTEPHVYLALIHAQSGRRADAAREAEAAMKINARQANDYFTDAVRMPANPDNLRKFIDDMKR